MAEDYLGRELSVGDLVVFIRHGYRELQTGRIKKLQLRNAK